MRMHPLKDGFRDEFGRHEPEKHRDVCRNAKLRRWIVVLTKVRDVRFGFSDTNDKPRLGHSLDG
jgi:hypothetical protein